MSARIPAERDPRSKWVKGIPAIAGYLDMATGTVAELLRTGELKASPHKRGGTWRTNVAWMDAYLAGEEPPAITGRKAS